MRPGSREMSTPNLPFPRGTTGGSGLGRSRQCFSRKINQPVADRVDDQLGGLVGSQSVHHVGTMDGDGVGAEVERGRNLFIGLAIHDHLQNFEFPRSEPGAAAAFERSRTFELGVEHGFAVRASPATTRSGSSSRMRRNPRRTRLWSSTSKTEIFSGMRINLPASFWGLAIEPGFLFHPRRGRAAKTQPCRPSTARAPASPPGQFPAWRPARRSPGRDLPLRLPKPAGESADGATLPWLPNAESSYSRLPARRGT